MYTRSCVSTIWEKMWAHQKLQGASQGKTKVQGCGSGGDRGEKPTLFVGFVVCGRSDRMLFVTPFLVIVFLGVWLAAFFSRRKFSEYGMKNTKKIISLLDNMKCSGVEWGKSKGAAFV